MAPPEELAATLTGGASQSAIGAELRLRHERRRLAPGAYAEALRAILRDYADTIDVDASTLPYVALSLPKLPRLEMREYAIVLIADGVGEVDLTARIAAGGRPGVWFERMLSIPVQLDQQAVPVRLRVMGYTPALDFVRVEREFRYEMPVDRFAKRPAVDHGLADRFDQHITVHVLRPGHSDENRLAELWLRGEADPVFDELEATFAARVDLFDGSGRRIAESGLRVRPNQRYLLEEPVHLLVDIASFCATDSQGWTARIAGDPARAAQDVTSSGYWDGSFETDVVVVERDKLHFIR